MLTQMITAAAAIGLGLSAPAARAAEKPTVVLVHGAFEDAGIWRGVAAGLEHDGYRTVAVDLPGRPSNPLPVQQITLNTYRDAVLRAVNKASAPVILVGHSFGGIVISSVADAAPSKVRTLVYLAALLPHDGDSLLSLAQRDPGSRVAAHLTIDKEHGVASIPADARADLFANDGNTAQRAAVTQAIVDEPLAPLAEPVRLGVAFPKVDRVYIHTTQDQVISPGGQAAMVAASPVRKETSLDTGHTPFVTDVGGLVSAIEEAAR